jgi:presqualene diphosphate phosphatase
MISLDPIGSEVPHNRLLRLDFQASWWLYHVAGKRLPSWLLHGLEHSGHGLFWLPAAFILFIWPGLNWKIRLCALNLEAGFLLDLLVIGALKLCIKRLRPSYAEWQYHATVIADQYSFPSGHASRCVFIAAMAYVFASHKAALFVICAAIWAMATSTSRVLLGRHYISDVVVGGVLGLVIAGALTEVRSVLLHETTRTCHIIACAPDNQNGDTRAGPLCYIFAATEWSIVPNG